MQGMNIGQALEHFNSGILRGRLVTIDNAVPTRIASYRGYYEDAAIECDTSSQLQERNEIEWDESGEFAWGVVLRHRPTLADLIEALEMSIGVTFAGYKGGEYTWSTQTGLWVSNYALAEGRSIGDVQTFNDRVNYSTVGID